MLPQTQRSVKCKHSLAAHLRIFAHVLPVERAALLNPSSFETLAVSERAVTYLPECARKRDFFGSAVLETIYSDVLYAVRNFKSFEILAAIKCLLFDSL